MTLEEILELWERVKHRSVDGFVPDTSQRIDKLYSKVPDMIHLLEQQSTRIKSLEAAMAGFNEAWSFNDSPTDMYAKCDKACEIARLALREVSA